MANEQNVKQSLQNLSKTIQPVLTPQGGQGLVPTKTTQTTTPAPSQPSTQK